MCVRQMLYSGCGLQLFLLGCTGCSREERSLSLMRFYARAVSPLCLRMGVELRWLSLCEACALVCVFWFVCCLLYAQLADLGSVWTPASLGFAVSVLGCVDDPQASYLFRFDAGPGPDWSSASQ